MNIKQCWFCLTGVKFQPITNRNGEIISTHSLCRNSSCPMNQKDLTAMKLKQKKSTMNSKSVKCITKKKNRFISGLSVGLISLICTFSALTSFANFQMPSNEITYQAGTATTSLKTKSIDLQNNEVTPEQFRTYFLEEATKAGVWVEKAEHMMQVESGGWNPHARGDQKVLPNGNGMCKNKKSPLYGKPANARGGAQITQCWFAEISDEQADDYKFATKFMLDVILSGKDKCRMIYSTCDAWYELQK